MHLGSSSSRMWSPPLSFFLFIMLVIEREAEGVLDLNAYLVDGAQWCSSGGSLQHSYRFQSRFGPLASPEINGTTQTWTVTYPGKEMDNYTFEGSRKNGSMCSYCPYHEYPETFEPEFFMPGGGGLRYLPAPMYGPCWDGRRSEKINCVQDQVFFPQEFVGEYFYPDQKDNPIFKTSDGVPFPIHQFLIDAKNVDDVNGAQISPSLYGLGRQRVLDMINSMIVMNSTSNTPNMEKTAEFRAPYMNDANENGRWLTWAQHYCSIGCHRNSQYRAVVVRPEDYQNKSIALSMLSRKPSSSSLSGLQLLQCKPCPAYQAAYKWNSGTSSPYNVKGNIVATQCFPWFGGIPIFLSMEQGKVFNVTTVNHLDASQNSIDGVLQPSQNDYVFTTSCPPDTYNDVCAHTLRYQINNDGGGGGNSVVQCKACPQGHHTDGLSGAWFCIPPAGTIFKNIDVIMSSVNEQNQSMIWSRRDRLGYEFECGYLAAHCHQCPTMTSTVGMLPDEFNRKMILEPLLATEPCPSKYFCPHPMKPYEKCPAGLPWSPPGSSSILNCTCAKGTYLSSETNKCEPCKDRSICGTGFYLAGWQKCNQLNGMTEGGTCMPCMNKQPSSVSSNYYYYYVGAPGTEVGLVGDASYGVCSFECQAGHILTLSVDSGNECFKKYGCEAVGTLVNSNNEPVYNSGLGSYRDSFSVGYGAGLAAASCEISQILKNEKGKAFSANPSWPRISGTCGSANLSSCLATTCTVVEEASFDRDFKCVSCPEAAPSHGKFTSAAASGSTKLSDRPAMCSVICDTGYYLNSSIAQSKRCSSCVDLETVVCPVGYRIKGQGCLGEFSLFNPSNMAASCIKCNISLENVRPNYYLTYEGVNGCTENSCPFLNLGGGTKYISTRCGGDSAGATTACSTQCAANQYKVSECSEYADIVCRNCTAFKPGYHREISCGVNVDAAWAACGEFGGRLFQAGYYCPGDGNYPQCPNGKTSDRLASSPLDCYCPVGTVKEVNGNNCMEFRCPEFELVEQTTPGVNYASLYYMKLNVNSRVTECVSCGGEAFTMGNNRVGFESCICPLQKYGTVSTASTVNGSQQSLLLLSCSLSCGNSPSSTLCSSSTTTNSGYKLSPPCWTGASRANAICQCQLPPFVEKAATTGCLKGDCPVGFISNGNNINLNVAQNDISTGSNVYVSGGGGWTKLYTKPTTTSQQQVDYSINKMITTYDSEWEVSSANKYQYALWTVKDPLLGFQIWTGPLPPLSSDIKNSFRPYDLNPSSWSFTCSPISTDILASYHLEDIAISPWASGSGSRTATVATFIKFNRQMLAHFISLTVAPSYMVYWGSSSITSCGSGKSAYVVIPDNSTVSCSSSYSASAFPVATPPVGTTGAFYMAYSELEGGGGCGVAAVFVNGDTHLSTTLLSLSTPSRRRITAMAVASPRDLTPNGVWLYLSFSNTPDRVQLVRWTSSSSVENEEIFSYRESGVGLTSLSLLWAKDWAIPVFFGADSSSSSSKQQQAIIVVADTVQRSWTEIQGMPLKSATSRVIVVETGDKRGLMVAASGNSIYSIPIQQCSVDSNSVPMFWDGSQCVSHTCVRARSCSLEANSGQEWNSTLMKCVCSVGYYNKGSATSISCAKCDAGFYCQNNVKFPCASSLTSEESSRSIEDCTCQGGQFYNSMSSSCPFCEKGSWCPNKWESFSCLGGFNAGLSQSGTMYPTGCVCNAGFTGPRCEPCPSGKYCPAPSGKYCPAPVGAIITATNLAVKLSGTEAAAVCEGFALAFSQLFEKTSMQYLKGTAAVEKRLLCKYIPASARSRPAFILVLQVEKSDASNVNFMAYNIYQASSANNNMTYDIYQVSSLINIYKIEPSGGQPASANIASNTEQTCVAGKTPTRDRVSCECAPGYESSTMSQGCVSCLPGYYKTDAGIGSCSRCPVGKTSKIASSTCISSSDSSNNNNNGTQSLSDSNSNNIPIIAGGVVGGVVLVALLIFGIIKAMAI